MGRSIQERTIPISGIGWVHWILDYYDVDNFAVLPDGEHDDKYESREKDRMDDDSAIDSTNRNYNFDVVMDVLDFL